MAFDLMIHPITILSVELCHMLYLPAKIRKLQPQIIDSINIKLSPIKTVSYIFLFIAMVLYFSWDFIYHKPELPLITKIVFLLLWLGITIIFSIIILRKPKFFINGVFYGGRCYSWDKIKSYQLGADYLKLQRTSGIGSMKIYFKDNMQTRQTIEAILKEYVKIPETAAAVSSD